MVTLLQPEVIWLMLLPSLLLLYLIGTNKDGLDRIFEKAMLEHLKVESSALSRTGRNILFFVALLFFILALSRPVKELGEVKIGAEGYDLVVAIDASISMNAKDVFPDRFAVAKQKAMEFLEQNRGNRIAISVFSRHSFVVSPLTTDTSTAAYLLKNLDKNVLSAGGTKLQSALESANKLLGNAQQKAILLITDGGDQQDFSEEIAFANQEHLQVYVLGIGSEEGSPIEQNGEFIKDQSGNIVLVKRNEAIAKLATESGGAYVTSTTSAEDVKALSQTISSGLSKQEFEQESIRDYQEYYPYPLALGLFFLLLAFSSIPERWKKIAWMGILFLGATPHPSYAGLFDFQLLDEAQKSYEAKEYQKSGAIYEKLKENKDDPELHYNLGNTYYRQNQYEKAIQEFSKVTTDDSKLEHNKLHNLGNSYTKSGKYDKAVEMFEKALKVQEDIDTRNNLEIVKKLLEQQQNSNQEQTQNQQGQNQDQQQESGDNSSESSDDGQQNEDNSQQQDKNNPSDSDNQNQQNQQQESSNSSSPSDQQEASPNQSSSSSQNGQNASGTNNSSTSSQDGDSTQAAAGEVNEDITDMEEKKWLRLLEDSQVPTYIYPVPEKRDGSNEQEINPW